MIESKTVKPNYFDRVIGYFSPEKNLRRMAARQMIAMAASYRAADTTRLRADWISLGTGDGPDPTSYDLQTIRERARDANRNDPVASGATETLKINIVGNGLKPQSQMRAERLGLSEDSVTELQHQAELAWNRFVPTADAANILTFDEIQFLALAKIIEDGETIVIPTWAREKWRHFGRCLQMVESERLTAPSAQMKKIKNGIEFGDRGQPKKYWIRKANAKAGGNQEADYRKIKARDSLGRPKILHIYATKRPGQTRGVPLFAPVLTYFKDLADYLEAEVVAARVAACLAVFVTKADATLSAYGTQTGTETSTNARIQGVEPGMVGYLNIGESINVVDPKRPGDTFGSFIEGILRIIGTSLNLPYELLMKDFSKTNYSSARAALLEGRRMFMNWRNWFSTKFNQPIWELVLEEAYLRGDFKAPNFYENRYELCRARWIGGAWGWVDPVKEVDASKNAVDYGLSTLAEEAAGQGRDWEEVLQQRKREEDKLKELGLVLSSKAGPGKPATGENQNANTE